MIEIILYVFGAFCICLFGFPLLGVVIGFVVMGLPYLAGIVFACITHNIFYGSVLDMGASYWLFGIVWAVLLVHARQSYKKEMKSAWHEGHYLAASNVLLMRRPYRKQKKAMVS